jgi:hypothetical protein
MCLKLVRRSKAKKVDLVWVETLWESIYFPKGCFPFGAAALGILGLGALVRRGRMPFIQSLPSVQKSLRDFNFLEKRLCREITG